MPKPSTQEGVPARKEGSIREKSIDNKGSTSTHHKVEDQLLDFFSRFGADVGAELDQGVEEAADLVDGAGFG